MSTELDSAMKSANTLIDMCGKLMAERDGLKAANVELAAALKEADRLYSTYGLTATGPGCGKWINSTRAALAKHEKETA